MNTCTPSHTVYHDQPCLPATGLDAGFLGVLGLLAVVAGLALRRTARA